MMKRLPEGVAIACALVLTIIYALPPICIYYTFRHRMASGLTMGGVKG